MPSRKPLIQKAAAQANHVVVDPLDNILASHCLQKVSMTFAAAQRGNVIGDALPGECQHGLARILGAHPLNNVSVFRRACQRNQRFKAAAVQACLAQIMQNGPAQLGALDGTGIVMLRLIKSGNLGLDKITDA